MTFRLLSVLLLGSALLAGSCHGRPDPRPAATSPELLSAPAPSEAAPEPPRERIDFTTQIQPLLEACRPCHFEGGKMYDRLPFDQPATLLTLGERLFTRIEKEEEQALIRAFLAQENG